MSALFINFFLSECTTNNIDRAWAPLADWLRENKRQAINTETGGGNTDSCVQFMCQQVAYQAANSDGKSCSLKCCIFY